MKTNQELGDIGAYAAASWLQSKARGYHMDVNEGREAFAAAVADEVRKESAEEALKLAEENASLSKIIAAANDRAAAFDVCNQGLKRERDELQNIADNRQEEIARLTAELDQAKKMISPYAHLEAAIADGKTIQWHDGKGWVDYLTHDRTYGTFFNPAKDYRVKPDATPDSNLSGIIDKAIEMVNTPGTTPETLPQAINAKIMRRDARLKETLKRMDVEREVTAKLRMDLKNCQLTKDDLHYRYLKGAEEIDRLRAELAKYQWRPVSVKPTEADADSTGEVVVTNGHDCFMSSIKGIGIMAGHYYWLPFLPPPPPPPPSTPTAEETERAKFEKWAKDAGFTHELKVGVNAEYVLLSLQMAWMGWRAARAGKEAK